MTCAYSKCGKEFAKNPQYRGRYPQRFCSKECAGKYWNEEYKRRRETALARELRDEGYHDDGIYMLVGGPQKQQWQRSVMRPRMS